MKKILLLLTAVTVSLGLYGQTASAPVDKLGVQFKSAGRDGSDVNVTVLVTNKSSKDATINLVGGQYQTGMAGSVAYDSEGNIYELGDILVAIGKKALTDQYCGVTVPAGVSIKCRVLIKDVSKEAKELTKLRVCVLCPELEINNTGVCFEFDKIKI